MVAQDLALWCGLADVKVRMMNQVDAPRSDRFEDEGEVFIVEGQLQFGPLVNGGDEEAETVSRSFNDARVDGRSRRSPELNVARLEGFRKLDPSLSRGSEATPIR